MKMDTEKLLGALKTEVNRELRLFFERKITEAKGEKKPKEILEMIEFLREFVTRAGKRIRPMLMCEGYFVAGGNNKAEIIKASASIELIHSYLLIHDDIIDRDNFRHRDVSMHRKYDEAIKNFISSRERRRQFGVSMAIIAGDLASSFGYEILADSDFTPEVKQNAISTMNGIVENTIIGEAMDVVLAYKDQYSMEDVINMQTYKTAKYTIEGPLHLGAVLAGADDSFLEKLSDYAIPLGISYQIQDDVIGIFGDEKTIGKPVGSDLKEGKKTLLILKAMENGNAEEREFLNSVLGKKNISMSEIEEARDVIKATRALEFSRREIQRLKKEALENLGKMQVAEKHKKFFRDFADLIVKRES